MNWNWLYLQVIISLMWKYIASSREGDKSKIFGTLVCLALSLLNVPRALLFFLRINFNDLRYFPISFQALSFSTLEKYVLMYKIICYIVEQGCNGQIFYWGNTISRCYIPNDIISWHYASPLAEQKWILLLLTHWETIFVCKNSKMTFTTLFSVTKLIIAKFRLNHKLADGRDPKVRISFGQLISFRPASGEAFRRETDDIPRRSWPGPSRFHTPSSSQRPTAFYLLPRNLTCLWHGTLDLNYIMLSTLESQD